MRPLEELIKNFDSVRIPVRQSDRNPGPYPYYGASGVVDYVDDFLFDGEYLLIAEDGENLSTRKTPVAFMASGKFWVNNHAHVVRGNTENSTRFLMYALRSVSISRYLTGSTMPKLTQGNLHQIRVPAPRLAEQERITHILGTLDDKIDLNRKMNQTLEAMARAIFKSWFIDFDPTRAKQRGEESTGIDPETAALFPDRLVDSELGPIPDGWEVKKLKDVAGVNDDNRRSDYPHNQIKYIKISGVEEGRLVETVVHTIEDAPSRAKRIVQHGDILWSKVRPNRKSYLYVHSPSSNTIASTGFAVLRAKEVTPNFLYGWVTRDRFVEYLTQNTSGSAYPAVRKSIFSNAKVLVPPRELLERYEVVLQPMRDKIWANDAENQVLAGTRDVLLPKLLSR